eukprot:gene8606-11630_t
MDSIITEVALSNNINEAIELFDRIFYYIAPTNTINLYPNNNNTGKVNNINDFPGISLNPNTISPKQLDAIKQLSGFLINCKTTIDNMRLKELSNSSNNFNNFIPVQDSIELFHSPTSLPLSMTLTPFEYIKQNQQKEKRLQSTITILQEYLVNELNRSEELELKLKAKDIELLQVADEKHELEKKYLKKKSGMSNGTLYNYDVSDAENEDIIVLDDFNESKETVILNGKSVANNSTKVSIKTKTKQKSKTTDPSTFIGRHIRKKFNNEMFFGLVTRYVAPFYEVVYEDADFEELATYEIKELLWLGSISSIKIEQCRKHAKRLAKFDVILALERTSDGFEKKMNDAPDMTNHSYQIANDYHSQKVIANIQKKHDVIEINDSSATGSSSSSDTERSDIKRFKVDQRHYDENVDDVFF